MKAILFDHDGVLADSESVFFEANCVAFRDYGLELSPEIWGKLYLCDDSRTPDVAAKLGVPSNKIKALVESRNEIYRSMLSQGVALIYGVEAAITALHGRVRMAIVTGCPRRQIDTIHGGGNFLDYFDCVITADDCSRTKPDPSPYLQAMLRMGLEPEDCVAIEDSPCGLRSATAAGLRCILIPTPLTDISSCGQAWKVCPDIKSAIVALGLGCTL